MDLEDRNELIHSKYKEQKNLNSELMKSKRTLEGQNAAMKMKVSKIEKEKEAMLGKMAKLEAEINNVDARVETLIQEKAKLETTMADLRKQHAAKMDELTANIDKLTSEKSALNSKLRMTRSQLGRAEKHNAKLCLIGQELLDAYEKKGVFGTLAESEPLTQLKKVEMEKLIQEYRDKIDDHELILE